MSLQIAIVYNKSNKSGLEKDAKMLSEQLLTAANKLSLVIGKITHYDPREPPVPVDICIHLEIPYTVWFGWSRVNCMMVNPEWWLSSWTSITSQFDVFIFKNEVVKNKALELVSNVPEFVIKKSVVVSWCAKDLLAAKDIVFSDPKTCVWFLGGSVSKRAAALKILPLWNEDWPKLTVYTTSELVFENPLASSVSVHVKDLNPIEHNRIARENFGHICISEAEGFGYTAAEAEEFGAYIFLNTLETYTSRYTDIPGVSWITTGDSVKETTPLYTFADFSDSDRIENDLTFAIQKFLQCDPVALKSGRDTSFLRKSTFQKNIVEFLHACTNSLADSSPHPKHMPPLLNVAECPPISIITLTYNRPKFIENAILNLLSTDYPRDKIEWVVVDDSDIEKSPSDRVVKFAEQFLPGKVRYVPCFKKLTIGRKRNVGCDRAANPIYLMMDDDDHYPSTSFRRRVAWLLKGQNRSGKKVEAAVCTTIAMYDLMKGVSAVNVPPYTLSLAERCSEATLTFTKSFWKERPFTEADVAEGEEFLKGRESSVIEMPPQQIIVAMNHTTNASSRRIPAEGEANNGCFWGFPKELLEFLHGLVGISVEEA
jgi:hypothetical protein